MTYNVITFSDGFDQHLKDLEETFMRIKGEGLKINTGKCRFGFAKTKFLGYQIRRKTVSNGRLLSRAET